MATFQSITSASHLSAEFSFPPNKVENPVQALALSTLNTQTEVSNKPLIACIIKTFPTSQVHAHKMFYTAGKIYVLGEQTSYLSVLEQDKNEIKLGYDEEDLSSISVSLSGEFYLSTRTRLKIFSREGTALKFEREIKSGLFATDQEFYYQYKNISGVLLDGEESYIADSSHSCVHIMNKLIGETRKHFIINCFSKTRGHHFAPRHLALGNDLLYIASYSFITVFTKNGEFKQEILNPLIKQRGTFPGDQFNIVGLAVDALGNLFIADYKKIYVFDKSHQFLNCIELDETISFSVGDMCFNENNDLLIINQDTQDVILIENPFK